MSKREIQLGLVKYVYDKFGIIDKESPFKYMKDVIEKSGGGGIPGQTTYYKSACKAFLTNREGDIDQEQLQKYDSNIQNHLSEINSNRKDEIEIRYYQYLSCLFSEFYFDMLSSNRSEFQKEVNTYITKTTELLSMKDNQRLNKIAYWMATGSGKTYIANINYHQFLHYFGEEEVDNIIMLAPNERVAKQHVREFKKNGINATRINDKGSGDVLVTDFDKLDKNSTGPKTVKVEEYGEKNMVFVDEGHKGLGSMSNSRLSTGWKALRDDLVGDNGYTVEYSATYGSSIKEQKGFQEYSSSIVFDYPYGRFHADGYGKDYKILNLEEGSDKDLEYWQEKREEWILLNILCYYEKLRYFEKNPNIVDDYNLGKPLSVFVGGRVNVVKKGEDMTDVEKVFKVFSKMLNKKQWVINYTSKLIVNKLEELEAFDNAFNTIQKEFHNSELNEQEFAEDLYYDIVKRLFDSSGNENLKVDRLNNGEGEIGLKTSSSEDYFGLMTVGDSKDFVDMLREQEHKNIEVNNLEVFSEVLFNKIDNQGSNLRFLLGSKKFAEGWDSIRPTNMALISLGKSKGPSIIQMFGRGVRLEGRDKDGKRDIHCSRDGISLLEKLHVFGIKASYMADFRDSLQEERVNTNAHETSELKRKEKVNLEGQYYRPKTFKNIPNEDLPVIEASENIDEVETIVELSHGIQEIGKSEEESRKIESKKELVNIVEDMEVMGENIPASTLNFNKIYHDVIKYKRKQSWSNLVIKKQDIKEILIDNKYSLYCDKNRVKINSFDKINRLNNLSTKVCVEVIENIYDKEIQGHEEEKIQLEKVNEDWLEKVVPDSFSINIDESSYNGEHVESLVQGEESYTREEIRYQLKKHYYNPIVASSEINKDTIDVHPEDLNKGEINFIKSASSYLEKIENKINNALILRNPSKIGIGFSSAGGYYPDFIIWINTQEEQHIIFVDPKGLMNKTKDKKKKINFSRDIKEYNNKPQLKDKNIKMHSYIVGRLDKTKNNNVRRKEEVISTWYSFLKREDYQGEGEKLLNNANIYLQRDKNDKTAEKIIKDAVDKL